MSPTTLEVKQLKKTFQEDLILNDLSFQLNKGEILSVVGPSGSGKTTLLRVLAGLESPTNGSLWMNGKDITATKANRRDISLVFQQPLLFPHMTVKENIAYGAKVSKKYSKPKIERLMEAIGMSRYRDHFPSEISGGQQQRTALARAMATEPEVILFDEPFSSLDPALRQDLRYWVRDFLVEQKTTALFVTHDMEEAMIMGDQIAVFQDGEFQQIGDASVLHHSPANQKVASFMGGHLILNENEFVPLAEIHLSTLEGVETRTFKGRLEHLTYQHGRPVAHISVPALASRVALPVGKFTADTEEVTLHIPTSCIQRFEVNHHE
ncbi:ATP-binding cassette domain-containing protein [Halobacillus litoralis]|uniref:Carnitine transport ATP-binding protein OpuCA n=1 Tax=Halobacillus litoralis TaxID=45668 RepID=A0A845DZK4_9BACI|nr:ABC transporter ATP-binding protein [Halobacillus litoralis]MYL21752.1 ATP-binding cassette domain-containing protein [Halobacillus litoralis]MYL39882.1 ATP-binding cassette domain-containing protein [Halobacillus litoralis]